MNRPYLPTGGTGGGLGGNGSRGGGGLGGLGLRGVGLSDISAPLKKSCSLQPLAVNLIKASETTDEIPIFLICESIVAGGPGELTGQFRMIRVVN